jgi:UDP-N-acetylglucosamine pyrophosphorylase
MNPNGAGDVTAALTTSGVIQAIVLQLIAHINDYALWVI